MRTIVGATLVFATAGALEGVSIAALYGAPWRWALHASAGFALVALFWVPVTAAVLRLWATEPRGRMLAAWLGLGAIIVVIAQPLWLAWINPLGATHPPAYAVRLASLSDTNVAFFLAIIGFACLGKFGGSSLAAVLAGLKWQESAALGILMNTRGLMELVVLNIGLDLRVLSPTLFAMLVIMALVTTFATTPLLDLFTKGVWEEASAIGGIEGS